MFPRMAFFIKPRDTSDISTARPTACVDFGVVSRSWQFLFVSHRSRRADSPNPASSPLARQGHLRERGSDPPTASRDHQRSRVLGGPTEVSKAATPSPAACGPSNVCGKGFQMPRSGSRSGSRPNSCFADLIIAFPMRMIIAFSSCFCFFSNTKPNCFNYHSHRKSNSKLGKSAFSRYRSGSRSGRSGSTVDHILNQDLVPLDAVHAAQVPVGRIYTSD